MIAVAVANIWAVPGTATIPNDPKFWPTAALTYGQRLGLVGHMPTQALFGERVVMLGRRGAWTHVAIPDQPSQLDARGYPGWVLTSELRGASDEPQRIVTSRTAHLVNGIEVGFGSDVPADSVPAADVRLLPHTRADLVRTAKLFLGLHYLWGGLSAWGYDCSGLVWAVYRAHGITIARDSEVQMTAGKPVTLADAKPGDLIFYEGVPPGHVAMLIGGGRMIESPDSAGSVQIVPIRPGYVGIRDVLVSN